MRENLIFWNRGDFTEVGRAECRRLRFIHGIDGAILEVDLLIIEAQRVLRPAADCGLGKGD